jgi:peptidyl-prolyl cis-trans isomerase D
MATLQTIRTKAGLLVAIVIGISLAAFILGDLLRGGSSIIQGDQLEIGEVEGESVKYPEFQQKVEELGEIYKMNTQQNQLDEETWVEVREQAWQNTVHQIIMKDVFEDLGLTVSPDELFDMIQGTNLHPIIQQLFRNPNTGQVDRSAVVRFLKNLETGVSPEQRKYWLYLEDQIMKERIQSKYNTLIGKGLFVTTTEAQKSLQQKNKQVNFDYILLRYNSIPDSQAVATDKDLKRYYDSHKENYKQEKIRRIEYITFPVTPSKTDYEKAEKWINDAISDFAKATDNVAFVNSNSDVGFNDTWYKKEELPEDIANWAFDGETEVNSLFGPYFEDEAYKLSKLHASEMMPDSVKARHILLQVNNQEELTAQQVLADSLKTAIENGSDFAALAREFSADQGSAVQGGDLGWVERGQMVGPFEKEAFNNSVNEVSIVSSEFGIHIVQPTSRGKLTPQVQVATLVRNVVPSTQTYQDVYTEASKFAGENTTKKEFDAAVAEQELNKKVASVHENDRQINNLENSRSLIRAAYDSKVGKLIEDPQGSTIFDLGDNFVIATLVSATEEGIADFENVKERIVLNVIKEKKGAMLVEKIKTTMKEKSTIEALASELGTSVESASNINFNSLQIPDAGMEPKVIGTAAGMEPDELSEPVAGNKGVYIIEVTSVNQDTEENFEDEKLRLAQELTARATSQAYPTHRESAEIEDKRSKFY